METTLETPVFTVVDIPKANFTDIFVYSTLAYARTTAKYNGVPLSYNKANGKAGGIDVETTLCDATNKVQGRLTHKVSLDDARAMVAALQGAIQDAEKELSERENAKVQR